MIKGETVVLMAKTESGTDALGNPIYTTTETTVNNVVVGTPTFEAKAQEYNLNGRRLAFVLGIPKTDANDWANADIYIRGDRFHSYGEPMLQTAENVPGPWNLQVKVERYV